MFIKQIKFKCFSFCFFLPHSSSSSVQCPFLSFIIEKRELFVNLPRPTACLEWAPWPSIKAIFTIPKTADDYDDKWTFKACKKGREKWSKLIRNLIELFILDGTFGKCVYKNEWCRVRMKCHSHVLTVSLRDNKIKLRKKGFIYFPFFYRIACVFV